MPGTLSSITDVAHVRSLGGLNPDDRTGGPTDVMIEAAIAVAKMKMRKAVTLDVYVAVRDFSTGDLTDAAKAQKQTDFYDAEAYFALAALPAIAKNQQIGQTGLAVQAAAGQGTINFATTQDDSAIEEFWNKKAYDALADYLTHDPTLVDADNVPIDDGGVESDDGSFAVMMI